MENRKTAKIIFVGDLMFDRYIHEVAGQKGNDFIFEKISEYLNSADLVVVNLEGPIINSKSKSVGTEFGQKGHMTFTFNPGLAPTLARQNIKVVNLGNNHILNFGQDGLNQTASYLEKNNIKYFGDTKGDLMKEKSLVISINNIKLGLVNYNKFTENSAEHALDDIKNLKDEVNFLIVYTHWGQEYETVHNKSQEDLAHRFIDAGADAVIGTHPHVIQEKEIYENKPIYYCLGNFVFDQYFSDNVRKGLMVELEIDGGGKIKDTKETGIKLETNGQTEIVK